MVPASLNDRFVIRFCVCAENAVERDINIAYDIISQTARQIIRSSNFLFCFIFKRINNNYRGNILHVIPLNQNYTNEPNYLLKLKKL